MFLAKTCSNFELENPNGIAKRIKFLHEWAQTHQVQNCTLWERYTSTWKKYSPIVTFYIWKTRNGKSQKFGSSFDMANPMDTEYSRKFLQDCRYMSHLHFWTFWHKYTTVDRTYKSMFEPVQTWSSKILMASRNASNFCMNVLRHIRYKTVHYGRDIRQPEKKPAR